METPELGKQTTGEVLENREHFKAGLIDFTAGSLGKCFSCLREKVSYDSPL